MVSLLLPDGTVLEDVGDHKFYFLQSQNVES